MFKENKLYREESGYRVYMDEINSIDIFYSELCVHLLNHFNYGYKIYYLYCKSNHTFSLNSKEINYLSTFEDKNNESLYYFFSENIKKIKCFQKNDLFYLSNLENLGLLMLIPKLDENNKYYFNLILCVKPIFNIEQFINLNFNSIILKSVIELNDLNLSENFLKKIFDCENNKFKDKRMTKEEFKLWKNEMSGESENDRLSKKGMRISKKINFKNICFHMYWLHSEQELFKTTFQVDCGFKEKMLIKDSNNELKIIESYNYSSLDDMILNAPEVLCFSAWRLYQYVNNLDKK